MWRTALLAGAGAGTHNFRFRPVARIAPFGNSSLSWFGLTDGWYWLSVGRAELFRYSREFQATWETPAPEPYVDYYIARLWEDLLEMLPTVLDPVPDALAERVASAEAWANWKRRAEAWVESCEDDTAFELYNQAVQWWGRRKLDTGYLVKGPQVWMWRVEDLLRIRWDNTRALMNGAAVWEAVSGETAMPVPDFLGEVHDFNGRFLTGMAERVERCCRQWERPEVDIDLPALSREHRDRAHWLARSLSTPPTLRQEHHWTRVMAAVRELEAMQ